MFYIYLLIVICYCVLVFNYIKTQAVCKRSLYAFELEKARKTYEKVLSKKESFILEKAKLEEDFSEIFTLYEIAKEIITSQSEEEACILFKKKLRQYVLFEECQLFDPLDTEIKEIKKSDDYFVFDLQGKRKRIGYLVIKGLLEKDKEKVMILGHQFALALRRVKLYKEIERIAITDGLTDVYTRRYIIERFEEEITRSKSHNINMSALMIDVDFFKKINDTYGHLTGDQVLREIAVIIKNNIREIDIPGRYGGEEFCVILPDTDRKGALYVAERIRKSAESAVLKIYDETINVTLSIGTATFPIDGSNHPELLDKADWALYRAKKQGRNKVCSFGVYKA